MSEGHLSRRGDFRPDAWRASIAVKSGDKRVMITLETISRFLDHFFALDQFAEEQHSILQASAQPVKRLGLALEPWPGLSEWAQAQKLDAVFLHRARHLETGQLGEGVGVVAYHAPFDARLMLGFNPRLADALGMTDLEVLGYKQGRPLGMLGTVRPQTVAAFYRSVEHIFGGREDARTCERNEVDKVAVVGAMTGPLVHEASERGADVYITGQFRQPGRVAVLETGVGVITVGHRRSEEWGLRALSHVLQERFADLEIIAYPLRIGG